MLCACQVVSYWSYIMAFFVFLLLCRADGLLMPCYSVRLHMLVLMFACCFGVLPGYRLPGGGVKCCGTSRSDIKSVRKTNPAIWFLLFASCFLILAFCYAMAAGYIMFILILYSVHPDNMLMLSWWCPDVVLMLSWCYADVTFRYGDRLKAWRWRPFRTRQPTGRTDTQQPFRWCFKVVLWRLKCKC